MFLIFSDPNVDVIFISPVPLSEETLQYYSKLLGLKSAIDSGVVEDQADFNERYKIIVPEAIKSFPVSSAHTDHFCQKCLFYLQIPTYPPKSYIPQNFGHLEQHYDDIYK